VSEPDQLLRIIDGGVEELVRGQPFTI